MKVNLYNQKNEIAGEIDLPERIFNLKWNPDLVYQVLVSCLSNKRQNIASTKDRGEVRGGGRKPWRQKGTGRARHGSIRSPIWKGGGITFGPSPCKNYTKKINKKMKRKAFFVVLSKKLKDGEIKFIESFKLPDSKTKSFVAFIKNFIKPKKESLLIIPEKDNKNIVFASRNVPKVKTLHPESLNIYDLLKYKYIFLTKESIEIIKNHYSL